MGDDQLFDQELRPILCEERPDPADVVEGKSVTAVMFGAQDSLSLRITPRFLSVDEGGPVTSSTVADRSI